MHKLHNKNEPYGSLLQDDSTLAIVGCGQARLNLVSILQKHK